MGSILQGAVLGDKFRIDAEIGKGGMGEVYRATHIVLNRPMAVKVLRSELLKEAASVSRFFREAKIAASLVHDHICEVTDFGKTEDGAPYLVMPLLKGRSLAELVADGKSLDWRRAVDIADQVLSALFAMHQAGIVHRDLKPENIFITAVSGREDFVKLLDFGISKLSEDSGDIALTDTGKVLGTPHYMSPEQTRGKGEVDHRTDLYAVGVLLYRLLTGRAPFDGSSYNEIIAEILTAPIPPLETGAQPLPQGLVAAVVKALARNPADRYGSAEKMRVALRSVATDDAAKEPMSTGRDAPGATGIDSPLIDFPQRAIRTNPPITTRAFEVESSDDSLRRASFSKKSLWLAVGLISTTVLVGITAWTLLSSVRGSNPNSTTEPVQETIPPVSAGKKALPSGAAAAPKNPTFETDPPASADTEASLDLADDDTSRKEALKRAGHKDKKNGRWIKSGPPGVVLDREYQ